MDFFPGQKVYAVHCISAKATPTLAEIVITKVTPTRIYVSDKAAFNGMDGGPALDFDKFLSLSDRRTASRIFATPQEAWVAYAERMRAAIDAAEERLAGLRESLMVCAKNLIA